MEKMRRMKEVIIGEAIRWKHEIAELNRSL
jgi:hypothetical protein